MFAKAPVGSTMSFMRSQRKCIARRMASLGTITFPLVLHYVDDMVTVSDEAIRRAMHFLWERMKLVVEPTGALAVAALLDQAVVAPDARIGLLISGGNIDLRRALTLFEGV